MAAGTLTGPDTSTDPAVSVCFSIKVDGQQLGSFTACSGLEVQVEVEEHVEGGNQLFVHKLPGRLKYTNVTLTRPLTEDSGRVAAWVGRMSVTPRRTQAEITARRPDGSVVATWNLVDVMPVRWKGPELDAANAKVATETLELAHHGFIDPSGGA